MDLSEKNEYQLQLGKIIAKLIRSAGIAAVEYQIQYLRSHPELELPTKLNHRETVRQYELGIEDFKKQYSKNNLKEDEK